jgi:hypothetical protein
VPGKAYTANVQKELSSSNFSTDKGKKKRKKQNNNNKNPTKWPKRVAE